MIDPLSAALGVFLGICVGVIIGTLRIGGVIEELKAKNTLLERELRRLTTRGPGGRFVKSDK